jgi:hypothetical protein
LAGFAFRRIVIAKGDRYRANAEECLRRGALTIATGDKAAWLGIAWRQLAVASKSKDWQSTVKGLLKAELKRRNLSYMDLTKSFTILALKTISAILLTRLRAAALPLCFLFNAWRRLV